LPEPRDDVERESPPRRDRRLPGRWLLLVLPAVLVLAVVVYLFLRQRSSVLVLTGIVTTQDVVVSPQAGWTGCS
jgi:hypothetical protein